MRTLDLGLVDLKSLDPWRWTLAPLELGIALLDSVTLGFCTLTLCTLSRGLRFNWRYSLLGLLLYPGKPSLSPIWSGESFLQGKGGSGIWGLVSGLNNGPCMAARARLVENGGREQVQLTIWGYYDPVLSPHSNSCSLLIGGRGCVFFTTPHYVSHLSEIKENGENSFDGCQKELM